MKFITLLVKEFKMGCCHSFYVWIFLFLGAAPSVPCLSNIESWITICQNGDCSYPWQIDGLCHFLTSGPSGLWELCLRPQLSELDHNGNDYSWTPIMKSFNWIFWLLGVTPPDPCLSKEIKWCANRKNKQCECKFLGTSYLSPYEVNVEFSTIKSCS